MADLSEKLKGINRKIGQNIQQGERDIAKRYARALVAIRAELAKNYEKFEKDGQLSMQDMLKHDRLKKMNQQIAHLMGTHYKDMSQTMDKILGGVYKDGYEQSAWAVETSAKANVGFSAVRPEALTAMLNNPINGLTLKDRLQKRRAKIIQAIQNHVTQGLQKNETYSTMAKRLKKELEGDAVKAMRIVRTEGHRVQESAKHDAMDFANGNGVIMMKQWNSQEDERVRRRPKSKADHKKLNNKKVPMDGTFNDGLSEGLKPGALGHASSDINCRCFLTYSIERVEKKEVPELEKLTFDQWRKERLIDEPKEKPKPKPKAEPKAKAPEPPKEPSWRDLETADEIKAAFSKEHNFNMIDMDYEPETIKGIARRVEGVYKKIPELKEYSRMITGTDEGEPGALAFVYRTEGFGGKFISMVNKEWSNKKKYDEAHELTRSNGILVMEPGMDVYSAITHEYGHVLSNYFNAKKWHEVEGVEKGDIIDYVKEKVVSEMNLKPYEIKAGLSTYGTYNNDEFFAESFAEFVDADKPRPIASKFGEVITGLLKKLGGRT